MWRLFHLLPLVLCLSLVGRENMRHFAQNVALSVGLLLVGTALLFFALTFLPGPTFFGDDFLRKSPAFDYFSVLAGLLDLVPITIFPVVVGEVIFLRKRNPRRAHLLLSISACFLLYASVFLEAFNLGVGTYLDPQARARGTAVIHWWWERHSATCWIPPSEPHVCDGCSLPP